MEVSSNIDVFLRWHDATNEQIPPTDTHILTSGGQRIPAHSNILASASSVLESMLYRPRRHWESERVIQILGVPCDAVIAFLLFLYSSRTLMSSQEEEDAIKRYGLHLMALSHKYRVGWLKRKCEAGLARQLSAEVVVDVLQVAKLCDASTLYQRCMSLIYKEFPSVKRTEAWHFVRRNDQRLELEILQLLQDTDQRKKRWWRERANQEMYLRLSEAMECFEHICTEGGTNADHHDKDPPSKGTRFGTCEGLRLLIRHFTYCSKKFCPGGSCPHCKRMWQLCRLHSAICDCADSCKVPLCNQFEMKMHIEAKGDEETWRLLTKKVITARVMSSLAKRKRPEQLPMLLQRYRGTK